MVKMADLVVIVNAVKMTDLEVDVNVVKKTKSVVQ